MITPVFSLAGTAVKAPGTGAKQTSGGRLLCADRSGTETQQPDAAGSVLWGLGSFPNKQGFRVTKALLAEE